MRFNEKQSKILCLTGIFLLTYTTSYYISYSAGFCAMAGIALGFIYGTVLSS